jgi:putative intracellular protease/amidase
MAQPRILMVLTSYDRFGFHGGETGASLEEFAAACYALADAGLPAEITSIKGGMPPIDPASAKGDTYALNRYAEDEFLKEALEAAPKLSDVATLEYDAVFLAGGPGALWDFPTAPELTVMLEQFHLTGKPIAVTGCALAALAPVMDRFGRSIVAGKTVSVFSDAEAEAGHIKSVMPFSLEQKMGQLGAEIANGAPGEAKVSVDGTLVTGQNAASAAAAAKALVELLNEEEAKAA